MRTRYTKYHEKIKRLIDADNMGNFTFFSDESFANFARYFISRINNEEEFCLYRYSPLERYSREKKEFVFSLDLESIYCSSNGSLNDIFEGLPYSEYDIHSIEECLEKLSKIAYLKCFTEDYKNNLMWAHYADCYRGVCIQYDVKRIKDIEMFNSIFPVSYTKKREFYASVDSLVDYFSGEKELKATEDTKGIFLQKSEHWKYEKEWRLCFMNTDCCEESYIIQPFDCVSAVYLGPRISKTHKEKVLSVIKEYNKNHNRNILAYKMFLEENTFNLKEKLIDIYKEEN
ncbi:MAG: DUF2971 domain-containing protein [Clostridia bacterium]|nr:DUF2971 domain-containing protein [Clostridia bacterium]